MLRFFWLFVILNVASDCQKIYSNVYSVILPPEIQHNLPNILDDDFESSANVYILTNRTFSLSIELQEESIVESVTIFTEPKLSTIHDVEVGFANNYERHSMKYRCQAGVQGYTCRFPCTVGNTTSSIIGKYIFWSILQTGASDWISVNDISIQGSIVKYENRNGNKVDTVLQKPFAIQDVSSNDERFCQTYYWKLFDKSPPRRTYEDPKNLTVYFGRNFLLNELNLLLSSDDNQVLDFYFGSVDTRHIKIHVKNGCTQKNDFEGFKQYDCSLSALGNLPVNRVTFFTDNISKLKIFGYPIHYPSVRLSTSEETGAGGISEFELTCTSVTCAVGSCEPPGEVAICTDLMLLRKPITGGPSSLVIRKGLLEPLWADILKDLKVLVVEKSKLVVRIPRTHAFVGQYQCGCESTDATKTTVFSTPTTFQRDDFLTESIFQRTYTTEYRGKRHELREGGGLIIELPTEGKGGFFYMTAKGITFAFNLNTKVEWTEDSERRNYENVHSTVEMVSLYPDNEALSNWTVSANRIVARDIYPDARDNDTVTYQWSLSSQEMASSVTDSFRIIDVDRKSLDLVRAWIIAKTDSLLHILVYCQHSNSSGLVIKDEVKVELLSHGCDPDAAPALVAAFGLDGKEAVINKIPHQSKTDVLTYGLAANLILRDYSTFYRYELQAVIGGNRTTLLDVLPSGAVRLKEELEAVKFNATMTRFYTAPESEEIRMELQVRILSHVLVDQLNCTRSSLKLTPIWEPIGEQNVSLQRDFALFQFTAPKSLKNLEYNVDLVVGENSKVTKISIPNPHYEKINIEFDNATGVLSWDFVSPELRPAVEEYAVVVYFKDIGCGTEENLTVNYLSALNCTRAGGCTTHLWNVEQLFNKRDILANYTITVNPKYVSFDEDQQVLGPPSLLQFTHGVLGHSEITVTAESTSPWAQAVTLLPSRRASCENAKPDEMDAVFELTAYAILAQGKVQMPLEGVEYKKLFISNYGIGGTYKVGNLQPGREYKIKGFLKYPGPISDLESAEMTFTTPDEIIVPEKYVLKDIGESLLFNCSAVVGTNPKYQKDLRWLRADDGGGGVLPEGAFSRTAPFPDARGYLIASLSIPRVDDTHAGVYCCSPEPPVEHFYGKSPRCAEFRLIVNDLKLDRYELEANPGMGVAVTCSTKREGDLQWRGPDGNVVEETRYTPASNATGGVQSLALLIAEVDDTNVGDYQCWFQPKEGEKRAPETFSLRLKKSLTIRRLAMGSQNPRFGEVISLTCSPNPPSGSAPKLRWFRNRLPSITAAEVEESREEVLEPIVTGDDWLHEVIEESDASGEVILRVRLTPSTQGRYVCIALPEASREQLTKNALMRSGLQHAPVAINYQSVVELSEPINLEGRAEVIVRCRGYPALLGERLEWAFKEFAVDTTYVFDDSAQGSFALSDKERISKIMGCFRPNHTKAIANWPGAEGYNPLSAGHELYSPDEIEIIALGRFLEDPVCQAALGQLVCRYRRPGPSLFATVADLGPRPRGRQLPPPPVEATISLDTIRDAFNGNAVQARASLLSADPNGSNSTHRIQIVTYFLLAVLAAFRFPLI